MSGSHAIILFFMRKRTRHVIIKHSHQMCANRSHTHTHTHTANYMLASATCDQTGQEAAPTDSMLNFLYTFRSLGFGDQTENEYHYDYNNVAR